VTKNKKVSLTLFCILVASVLIVSLFITPIHASNGKGIITFTFDDGTLNQYTTIFPLMQEYNIHGTFYIITGNYSSLAPDGLSQGRVNEIPISGLLTMQAAGNEIGSHTVTHHDLSLLTDSQIEWECSQSKLTLQSWGLNVYNLASPQGIGNYTHADTIVKQYYQSSRSFMFPYTPIALPDGNMGFKALLGVSAEYEGEGCSYSYNDQLISNRQYIDYATQNNAWVILLIHNVADTEESAMEYGGIAINDLVSLFQYAKGSGAQILTIQEALGTPITLPTSTPTRSPTNTPHPTIITTPNPTSTPTVKPTVTPNPTSTVKPTPIPTETIKPTVTPKPTTTSTPTPTPSPPINPTDTPTYTPTPTTTPTVTPNPTLTPTQQADYNTWINNGSALQNYKTIMGLT
jgi:peptidoglycan/xylan/chitin deacetylase (PgdA/CDA1 family)